MKEKDDTKNRIEIANLHKTDWRLNRRAKFLKNIALMRVDQ